MTHHTTGPWEVRERDHVGDNIFSADNKRIANTFGPPNAPEFAANARLIAAAPEMAAEIERLRDLLDRISTEAPNAIPACNCGEHEACNRCPFCGGREIRVVFEPSSVHCACWICGACGPPITATPEDDGQWADDQAVEAWEKRIPGKGIVE